MYHNLFARNLSIVAGRGRVDDQARGSMTRYFIDEDEEDGGRWKEDEGEGEDFGDDE